MESGSGARQVLQADRIVKLLERRGRWKDKYRGIIDAVKSKEKQLSQLGHQDLSRPKALEGWMNVEVFSKSMFSSGPVWKRFWFRLDPFFRSLYWSETKQNEEEGEEPKEPESSIIILDESCEVLLLPKNERKNTDDGDTIFRLVCSERSNLPDEWKEYWEKLHGSGAEKSKGQRPELRLHPEDSMTTWMDMLRWCICPKKAGKVPDGVGRDERKKSAIRGFLSEELRSQSRKIEMVNRARRDAAGKSGLMQQVEISYRKRANTGYQRQHFRLTSLMTFRDLQKVAMSFWSNSLPVQGNTKWHVSLKDSTGALWPPGAPAQAELTNRRRQIKHDPALVLVKEQLVMVVPPLLKSRVWDPRENKFVDPSELSSLISARSPLDARLGDKAKSASSTQKSGNFLFHVEIWGVILFIILSLLNSFLYSLPTLGTFESTRFAKMNFVETVWQKCTHFDPEYAKVFSFFDDYNIPEGLDDGSLTTHDQICIENTFFKVTTEPLIYEWANSVWFNIISHTTTKHFADTTQEEFTNFSASNYLGGFPNVQIIGDTLIWTTRVKETYEDFEPLDDQPFGSCDNSTGALCWSYMSAAEGFPAVDGWGEYGREYTGGHVIQVPVDTNRSVAEATVKSMLMNGFIDGKTRAVGFHVNLWTQSSGVFFSPSFIFEFSTMGSISPAYRTHLCKDFAGKTAILQTVIQIVQCLLLLSPLYVIVSALQYQCRIKTEQARKDNEIVVKSGYKCSCNKKFFKAITLLKLKPGLQAFLAAMVNIWEVFQIMFVMTYLIVVTSHIFYVAEMSSVKDAVRAGVGFVDLSTAQNLFRRLKVARGFSFLFALLKSMQFLRRIPVTNLLVQTLTDAFGTLISVFVLLLFFRVSLCCFSMAIYGTRTKAYNSFFNSFQTMTEILLGDVKFGKTIWGSYFNFFEIMFFFFYIFSEYYTWYALMVVVLTFYYKKNSDIFVQETGGELRLSDICPCFKKEK